MAVSAKVIEDSISHGNRLTTIEVTLHRFVLAEFNTHRSHSRNSASSRAIPVAKQLVRVNDDPAIPVIWTKEQPGMQGGDELIGDQAWTAEQIWLIARDHAVEGAMALQAIGVHKSITNRLLEPFMWHTIIASATDDGWANFFAQRCSPLAQPEIRLAAEAIHTVYDMSAPRPLTPGEWHLPYLTPEDRKALSDNKQRMVSVARCARVSYLTHDGVRDYDKDIELYIKLVDASPPHASPLEHVATPCLHLPGEEVWHEGNFRGWDQLRHRVLLPG